MKFADVVGIVIILVVSTLLAVHYFMIMGVEIKSSEEINIRKEAVIRKLNETYQEELILIQKLRNGFVQKEEELKRQYDAKILALQNEYKNMDANHENIPVSFAIKEIPAANANTKVQTVVVTSNTHEHLLLPPDNDVDNTCQAQYGLSVITKWKATKETWCYSDVDGVEYRLDCYPYHQEHKRRNGKGKDMFCEARNVVIDFGKVKGDISYNAKPNNVYTRYFNFDPGLVLAFLFSL